MENILKIDFWNNKLEEVILSDKQKTELFKNYAQTNNTKKVMQILNLKEVDEEDVPLFLLLAYLDSRDIQILKFLYVFQEITLKEISYLLGEPYRTIKNNVDLMLQLGILDINKKNQPHKITSKFKIINTVKNEEEFRNKLKKEFKEHKNLKSEKFYGGMFYK